MHLSTYLSFSVFQCVSICTSFHIPCTLHSLSSVTNSTCAANLELYFHRYTHHPTHSNLISLPYRNLTSCPHLFQSSTSLTLLKQTVIHHRNLFSTHNIPDAAADWRSLLVIQSTWSSRVDTSVLYICRGKQVEGMKNYFFTHKLKSFDIILSLSWNQLSVHGDTALSGQSGRSSLIKLPPTHRRVYIKAHHASWIWIQDLQTILAFASFFFLKSLSNCISLCFASFWKWNVFFSVLRVQIEGTQASGCSKSPGAAFHGEPVSSCSVLLGAAVQNVWHQHWGKRSSSAQFTPTYAPLHQP